MSTFSISGTIANGVDVTLLYTGTSSGSAVSDSAGSYTIPNLTNGTYTVTPDDAAGVSPPLRVVVVSGADVTGVNFYQGPIGPFSGVIATVNQASYSRSNWQWGLITIGPVGPQSSQVFYSTLSPNNDKFTIQVGQAVNFAMDAPGGGILGVAVGITNA